MDLTATHDRLAFRILPESPRTLTRLWLILPFAFLLAVSGLALLCPSPLTPYYPLLAISGWILCARFRRLGLGLSLALLAGAALFIYRQASLDVRLWQWGLLGSYALDFMLTWLCLEEVDRLDAQRDETVLHVQQELGDVKKAWDEQVKGLEAELKKWKEEAEHRRIEKRADDEKLSLVQAEIDRLTTQKEAMITEAFEARRLAAERLQRLESQIEQNERLTAHSADAALHGELEAKAQRIEELQAQLADHQPYQDESLRSELEAKSRHIEQLQAQISEHQLHQDAPLRAELEEKARRIEQLQAQLAANQLHQDEALNTELVEKAQRIQQLQSQLEEQRTLLEQTEAKLAQQETLAAQTEALQAKLADQSAHLEQMRRELEHAGETQQPDEELRRRLAAAEGLYKQLREQFEEKSSLLEQTRQELFSAQTILEMLAKEKEETAFSSEWAEEIARLREENAALEEEIKSLEELVSRSLSP